MGEMHEMYGGGFMVDCDDPDVLMMFDAEDYEAMARGEFNPCDGDPDEEEA